MATALYRLGRTAYRRWPIFLAAWVIALVGLGATAAAVQKPLQDTFSIPGIPSLKAQDMERELFPNTPDALDLATVDVAVAAPKGHTLKEPQYTKAVDSLIGDLRKLPQMPKDPKIANPVQAAQAQYRMAVEGAMKQGTPKPVAEANAKALLPLSADGRIGTMTWNYDVPSVGDVKQTTRDQLTTAMEKARKSGLTVEANGSGMQEMPETGGKSELIGIGIALLVLIITFGSLVAAGMPIISALIGVATGMFGMFIATHFVTLPTTTSMLATMIGLAVGIDYTLFILSRYRTELRHTDDRSHAAGLAVGKAGSAVVFAGLTVLIALAALSVVGIPFLTYMGLAAAGTVFCAVVVALTLLPAVLGMLKSKAFGGNIRKRHIKHDADGAIVNNGTRWGKLIGKAPALVVVAVVVVLGALAVPMRDMHLALPSDSTAAKTTTQRKAADLVTEGFGPGRQAPFLVVVNGKQLPQDPKARIGAYTQVVKWAAGQKDVANAQMVAANKDMSGAQIMITPKTAADDTATGDLLTALRDGQKDIQSKTHTTVGITGRTAIEADVSDRLTGALPTYLAVVIGLAFVLLMVVFRSILVPLTATLGFLLSVLATLGATVMVFQKGDFGLVEGAPLVSFMPIMLIGLVFGLAMDYQVFLVTRMREAYVHGASARESVLDGFRHAARVVVAAATIMISVFAAFIFQSNSLIMSMGFALAIAVFFDAFLIRMTLIPALMYLMGDSAWKLPKWLDKILPSVDVEGEKLQGMHPELEHEERPAEDEIDDDAQDADPQSAGKHLSEEVVVAESVDENATPRHLSGVTVVEDERTVEGTTAVRTTED